MAFMWWFVACGVYVCLVIAFGGILYDAKGARKRFWGWVFGLTLASPLLAVALLIAGIQLGLLR